ncbi:MAG: hypothetical protein L0206_04010, partial [Actinobacteria bacterium]|nr:hypothetical protein [Actinomycetota bacterium]
LAADLPVEVDMIERLPTPWGLVRLGVAPDHPNIKAVSRVFEKIAKQPGFRFLGNVEVGRDLEHGDLMALYDAVVYAVGAQTDRRLGIPGEDLPGSWPATVFVAWYNGHPDFQDVSFDLSCERAVVVGNGNVAIDVARMLALAEPEIAPTDTTDPAIDAILGSGIEEIVMLGRRGPAQASFTTPELKELGELADADVVVHPAELELEPASEAALSDSLVARNLEVLREYAARPLGGKRRRLELRFRVSPVAILGNGRVEAVEVVHNDLVADDKGTVRAVPTDERELIPCGAVFRSVGYRGVPVPGVPFDEETGVMRNRDGRVLDERGEPVPGVYCAGWIKRGPTGVIGTNKKDATETVELLLEDVRAGASSTRLRNGHGWGSTRPAGSSADRPASSVPTSPTPPRPWRA